MDNKDFLRLVDLLEKESFARIAAESVKTAEIAALSQIISDQNTSFGQTIHDLNATIVQLNHTIGRLLEENRLLKGPKKNS
ncbi:hypothetical protein AAKU52_002642, partial [Pedobacter sp. CG_S7]|uniref:hypothetical protein n=1 Tax=Pedobacter sp. CG_S7 TaxID=3143930 RepID=UPI003398089E